MFIRKLTFNSAEKIIEIFWCEECGSFWYTLENKKREKTHMDI